MKLLCLLWLVPCVLPLALVAGPGEAKGPLALSIHYSNGLSAKSSPVQPPQIILFKEHTHIHMLISNISQKEVVLWRPYCPPGDDAIIFEFKDSESSKEVMPARISMGYTAGMGFAKTLTLVPNDTLVVNADFLNYWKFPFKIQPGRRTMFVRAVYDSKPSSTSTKDPKAKDVWMGRVETAWEKVEVVKAPDSQKP